MAWEPTTDFEEEIINLQPDHDFVYGGLTEPEPQPIYPRPKAHVDYAKNLKKEAKKQQELYETTGRMNEKLHVITQVQRMAGTKPLGEQPTLHDWDSNKNIEKETIGMMRCCGMGPSLEEPLNKEVTIATYPVEKNMQIVKNGRKNVPVFFDENIFKLKPKVSSSSSGFDSLSNSSESKDDSQISQSNQSNETSFNTTASSLDNSISFYTGETHSQDSNNSAAAFKKAQIEREALLLKAERMKQYDKLQEDTSSLTLSSYNNSFETAKDSDTWMKPCVDFEDEDDSFDKNKVNWPPLQYNEFKPSENWHSAKSSTSTFSTTTTKSSSSASSSSSSSKANKKNEKSFSKKAKQYTFDDTSETSSTNSSASFMDRFVTPPKEQLSQLISNPEILFSTSNVEPLPAPSSYADMAKNSNDAAASSSSSTSQGAKPKLKKENIVLPSMPRFYTAREIYNMKRRIQ